MRHPLIKLVVIVLTILIMAPGQSAPKKTKPVVPPVLNFTMKDIDGKRVHLAKYSGKVIMIVNTASLCGNTPQYAGLQKLYDKYKDKGFVVLGFPSNDFNQQEPGTNKEIKAFCALNYSVKFPMFSKIVVKGKGQAPLYQYLTSPKTNPKFSGEIEWNFAKFLISRKGEIVARYPASEDPTKPEIVQNIEQELARKKPGKGK